MAKMTCRMCKGLSERLYLVIDNEGRRVFVCRRCEHKHDMGRLQKVEGAPDETG